MGILESIKPRKPSFEITIPQTIIEKPYQFNKLETTVQAQELQVEELDIVFEDQFIPPIKLQLINVQFFQTKQTYQHKELNYMNPSQQLVHSFLLLPLQVQHDE
ncbi:hypothetical protein TTHERM_000942771 (macronuclear) [Tetrahymena thermophila SB210]|uniref:Uncharacterized protein n=1 Tax=Tetrahymena thermophila (strain SB210) TaxID=312017 RepID=W7XDQ8_TETTS|nr:hypothetical protein TTHERM_000942771 [Tetrahymena thermophila SB210]EWS75717.1 hypothetical protein TTHERM_000942771 [Tetrahymena thermophila SB210]|eukprot:XP_012651740.1 hypothetical protein TTHERM_000942771 [Tetrahymena thermophila SB210]